MTAKKLTATIRLTTINCLRVRPYIGGLQVIGRNQKLHINKFGGGAIVSGSCWGEQGMGMLSGAIIMLAGAVALAGGAVAEAHLVSAHRSVGVAETAGYAGMVMAVLGLGVTAWGAFSGEGRSSTPP